MWLIKGDENGYVKIKGDDDGFIDWVLIVIARSLTEAISGRNTGNQVTFIAHIMSVWSYSQ